MEARYATRKQQLLAECQVAPEIFDQVMPRLETFMGPFVETFCRQEPPACPYLCLWLALGCGTQKRRIDRVSLWTRPPAPATLHWLGRVGGCPLAAGAAAPSRRSTWATPMACWSSTPRPFPSLGPSRWAWRASGAAVWAKSTTVKWRSTWATSRARAIPWWTCGCTCPKHGPQTRRAWTKRACPHARRGYRSRHQLALDMLEQDGRSLPHGWIAGDDEMGRPYWFRRRLAGLGERYMLAVLATR